MADEEYEDFYLSAIMNIMEAPIHERLLLVEIDVIVSPDDADTPALARLDHPHLAKDRTNEVVARHKFHMMRDFIWTEEPDLSYQAGEFDAVNSLLPDMAYAVADTPCNIFRANDMLVPALALGEEEHFWHHAAFATGDIWKLCLAMMGQAFSSHEPMLVVQAIDRGTSNHQKLETRALLQQFPDHRTHEGGDIECTYCSLDVLGDYQLGFFSPGRQQRPRDIVPCFPERLGETAPIYPFLSNNGRP